MTRKKLPRDLQVTQKTVRHLAHRLRTAYARGGVALGGPVEADESYVGGARKNMSRAKRAALNGRGTVGKSVVIGLKNRGTNKVRAKVVPSTDAPTLQGFVRDKTEPEATVYTDEASAYLGLARDYDHESVNHSAGEYSRGMAGKRLRYADLTADNGLHSGARS